MSETLPENHNKKWLDCDLRKVRVLWEQGFAIKDIAKAMGRTNTSIAAKLVDMRFINFGTKNSTQWDIENVKNPYYAKVNVHVHKHDYIRVKEMQGDGNKFREGDIVKVIELSQMNDTILIRPVNLANYGEEVFIPPTLFTMYSIHRFEFLDGSPILPRYVSSTKNAVYEEWKPSLETEKIEIPSILSQVSKWYLEHPSQVIDRALRDSPIRTKYYFTKGEIKMTAVEDSIFEKIKQANKLIERLTESITDEQIFDEITRLESEIKRLKGVDNQPKFIKEKISNLQTEIDKLVKFSDERK